MTVNDYSDGQIAQPWPLDPDLLWADIWAAQGISHTLVAFASWFESTHAGIVEELRIRRGAGGQSFMIKVGYRPRTFERDNESAAGEL